MIASSRGYPRAAVGRDLSGFYDSAYARGGERHAAWRELGARGKADHVLALVASARLEPVGSVAEIGCGDGALLAELASRGFGESLAGFDISSAAIELAEARGVASVSVFDGAALPVADRAFDLGILSHVLEHVPDPLPLLREAARACRALVVEVPLERNASGARESKRATSEEIGHLAALDRAAVRRLVADAGLRIEAELLDPLPREVHTFFAKSPADQARGLAKAAVRRSLFRVAPRAAERAFTLHYACACVPA
jgi:SAM-dependent methyltransferase